MTGESIEDWLRRTVDDPADVAPMVKWFEKRFGHPPHTWVDDLWTCLACGQSWADPCRCPCCAYLAAVDEWIAEVEG